LSTEMSSISPRSAVHADTFPTSSKPSPIPAERTDRDRFASSCARGSVRSIRAGSLLISINQS
jgi:hypothetical protein